MANKLLTKKQQKILKRLANEITNIATEIVEDYKTTSSELSGSITQVHENSPLIDEMNMLELPNAD